jgi:hypothetical protein
LSLRWLDKARKRKRHYEREDKSAPRGVMKNH